MPTSAPAERDISDPKEIRTISWDASLQAWRIAWTNPVSGHREQQVGNWKGRDILQTGERADGTKTRWTFTDITPDSFHWRGEALYPNATTWTLEGEFLAKRV